MKSWGEIPVWRSWSSEMARLEIASCGQWSEVVLTLAKNRGPHPRLLLLIILPSCVLAWTFQHGYSYPSDIGMRYFFICNAGISCQWRAASTWQQQCSPYGYEFQRTTRTRAPHDQVQVAVAFTTGEASLLTVGASLRAVRSGSQTHNPTKQKSSNCKQIKKAPIVSKRAPNVSKEAPPKNCRQSPKQL